MVERVYSCQCPGFLWRCRGGGAAVRLRYTEATTVAMVE